MAFLLVWVGVLSPTAAPAAAAEETPDQVWLISTRSAPTGGAIDAAAPRFGYWRLGDDRHWERADLDAMLATNDPDVPMTVVVHGNRADRQTAIGQSWSVYRHLKREAAGRRFRFVIWSWPSDRIRGSNLRDLRVKACRSDTQGYYLAWYLDQLRADTPVSLVGYSFGARVVTGALHIMAGGRSAGHRLKRDEKPERRPARVVLVAAAIDNDWLLPGHNHGLAMTQVESMLVTQNPRDRALRWYPAVWRRHPHALGSNGLASLAQLGSLGKKIKMIGLGGRVGKEHAWLSYLSAPELRAQLPSYAFLDTTDDTTDDTAVAARQVTAKQVNTEMAHHLDEQPGQRN